MTELISLISRHIAHFAECAVSARLRSGLHHNLGYHGPFTIEPPTGEGGDELVTVPSLGE